MEVDIWNCQKSWILEIFSQYGSKYWEVSAIFDIIKVSFEMGVDICLEDFTPTHCLKS